MKRMKNKNICEIFKRGDGKIERQSKTLKKHNQIDHKVENKIKKKSEIKMFV